MINQDLVVAIGGKTNKPASTSDKNWNTIDEKAMAEISLSLSPNVLFNVNNEKTTKVVCEKLQNMYKMTSTANKIFIMKKLYKLKMRTNQ